jgi:asparagine synthetase B (glutamine-hydrolysing)
MTGTMARRGPDAGGVWVDRHVGLGHRRLAVIDRAGGLLVQESLVRECAAKARLFPI